MITCKPARDCRPVATHRPVTLLDHVSERWERSLAAAMMGPGRGVHGGNTWIHV